ncbi:hypothetical protein ACFLUM_04010 [Chloroflexota bacterium]
MMPVQQTLLLAVTKMHGGMCIAGMTTEPDRVTGLRWVRPVRDHAHVMLGDVATAEGQVLRPFDVAELNLVRPRAEPPHTEDWVTDFARHRPRVVRRLEGDRRATFLSEHLDSDADQVLTAHERSLCLIRPDWMRGAFRLDSYSGKLEARITFGLGQEEYLGSQTKGGLSVTDIKWRALGRSWLPDEGGLMEFEKDSLKARLGAREIFLVAGLTRSFKGDSWPIIVGVHLVPDYEAEVDYANL